MVLLFTEFLFYSFVGFVLEVLHARFFRLPGGRKALLFLPLCPVYGIGALLVLTIPPILRSGPVVLFVAGGLLATLVEYAASVFYELGTGIRFWDYSQRIGNLGGRICHLYTFVWGLLALLQVYVFQPVFLHLLERVPAQLAVALFFTFAADALVSLWLLSRTGDPDCLMWYRPYRPSPGVTDPM